MELGSRGQIWAKHQNICSAVPSGLTQGAGNAFFLNRKLPGKSFEGWAEGMVAKICDNIFSIQKMKCRLALMVSGELCWQVGT